MRLKFKCLSLGLGASALLIGATAMAGMQHYTAPPPPPHTTFGTAAAKTPHINPQTLAKFKRAFQSVKAVEQQYSAKMRSTHGAKAAQSLRKWARTKMVSAVKAAGLTVQKYNHVMMVVQGNPALRKKILGH